MKKKQFQSTTFIVSNYLKVSTKKAKWSKVKAKTVEYFKNISIPGVSQIVTSESYVLKLLWTVLILCVFGFGLENISLAVVDYYKFDKITNIERVNPEYVTFPAITICTSEGFLREHFRNGSLIKRDTVSTNLVEKFVDLKNTIFYSYDDDLHLLEKNHIDTFKMKDPNDGLYYDYIRFNALTNRSVELLKANIIQDHLRIVLSNFYREDISDIEYYRYSFLSAYFYVYIGDNSLNTFENLLYS